MKKFLTFCFLALTSLFCMAQESAVDDANELSAEDKQSLIKIINLVDEGLSSMVIEDFDNMVKKYPGNYTVLYERAYALYKSGRYGDVIKDAKSLLKHKYASELAFQLIGNAYDLNGDRKKAVKTYLDGIKRFPESGALYLELGNIYYMEGEYNKALTSYNKGVLAQPNLASNYYHASRLYMSSKEAKVWGLIYSETAILLAPTNNERQEEMAAQIVDCLKDNIVFSDDGEKKLQVNLASDRKMQIDNDTKTVYLDFPGIYEGLLIQQLLKMMIENRPFTCSLKQLIELRKGLVETYYSVTDNLYGNSMYLFEFQKKVIDAGHWDAYNYYLFMNNFPEELEEWYSTNKESFEAFIDWYNKDPFTLGNGRSVNPMQIFQSYTPIDMIKGIRIQGQLTPENTPKTAF